MADVENPVIHFRTETPSFPNVRLGRTGDGGSPCRFPLDLDKTRWYREQKCHFTQVECVCSLQTTPTLTVSEPSVEVTVLPVRQSVVCHQEVT